MQGLGCKGKGGSKIISSPAKQGQYWSVVRFVVIQVEALNILI